MRTWNTPDGAAPDKVRRELYGIVNDHDYAVIHVAYSDSPDEIWGLTLHLIPGITRYSIETICSRSRTIRSVKIIRTLKRIKYGGWANE